MDPARTGSISPSAICAFARMYGYERPEEMIGIRAERVHAAEDPSHHRVPAACVQSGFRVVDDGVGRDRPRGPHQKYFLNNWVGIIEAGHARAGLGYPARHHRTQAAGGAVPPGAEDGDRGPARGRDSARLQQPAHRDPRAQRLLLHDLPPETAPTRTSRRSSARRTEPHGLTRQLLAFSRRQVLQPRILDLNAVVLGTENMLQRVIGEDISLVTDLAPDLGLVKADPGQVDQVILNLVGQRS